MKKKLLLFMMLLCSLNVLSQTTDRTENGTSTDDGANNPVNEGEPQAFDNNNGSKWLIFNSTGNIGYDFSNEDAYVINSYSITSANDASDRDPKNWNLQGSNDGSNWTTVDSQNNQGFSNRGETKTYNISNTTSYKLYRLNVTANNGSGLLQIAEIQMFSGTSGGGGGGTTTDRTESGTSTDDGANNPVNEGEAQAFDNNNGSKWLIFSSTGNVGYDFANDDAYAINSYSITSANDASDRDPKNWNLQGSNDGSNWTTVDSQNNQGFGNRSETKTYNISNTTAYKLYRLNVTANNGSGLLQIGEVQMFGSAGTSGGGGGGGGGTTADRTENGVSTDDGANNPVGEGDAQAFDNNNSSKWLIFTSTGNIGYDFANDEAYTINSYSITSANDAPDRDPKNWNLQGSNDGSNWTTVDSQNNQGFGNRGETKTYNISNTTSYKLYRLNVTANNGSGLLQIAEIQMFGPSGTSGGGGGGGGSSDFLWYLDNDIKVYAKDLNPSGYNTKSPFYLGQCSLSVANGGVQFLDMYPEDGWMLVGKSFGESSTGTTTAPFPFFALYNKYRGTLRVMIYRPNNAIVPFSTGYLVNLSLQNDDNKAPLFTFNQNTKCFLDEFDQNAVLTSAAEGSFIENWIWADFNLIGYDPALITKPNLRLAVQLTAQDFTQVNINGTLNLSGYIGAGVQPSGNSSQYGVNDALANGLKFVKGGTGLLKEVQEFMKPYKIDVPNGGYTKFEALGEIADGIKPISDFLATVTPFAQIFNFGLQLLGGSAPAAPTPINLSGSIKLTGSLLTSRPGSLGIIGLNTNYPATGAEIKPSQTIPWGIINFRRPIKLDGYLVQGGGGAPTTYNAKVDLGFEFNNNCGMNIESIEAKYLTTSGTATTIYDGQWVSVYPVNNLRDNFNFTGTSVYPGLYQVKIVLNIISPTKTIGNKVVIYQKLIGSCASCKEGDLSTEEYLGGNPFPNPSSTSFSIPVQTSYIGQSYQIKIFSSNGTFVTDLSGNSISLSDSIIWDTQNSGIPTNINSGLYLCEVLVGEKITTHKLIVQK